MSTNAARSYRFSTAAQWGTCLFERADRGAATIGLRPFASFNPSPVRFDTRGAHAPAVTPAGEVLWRDEAGVLYRLPLCADAPEPSPAPGPLARAKRIAATTRGLWVASCRPASLQLFEEETLTRLLIVELPDAQVTDVAGDGRGGVYALVERGGAWQAIHVDGSGHLDGRAVPFKGVADASAFVFLRREKRFVVLGGKPRQRLDAFAAEGGAPVFSLDVGAVRPCFHADALGSDASGRVFLAGTYPEKFGGGARVLSFDADGNALSEVPLDPKDSLTTGVAAARGRLFVTGPRGLLRFETAAVVPDAAGGVQAAFITPMLQAPDREDGRRWLRIEASSVLPAGSALEIAYAATDDVEVRNRLAAIAADASLTPSQRFHRLRGEPEVWSEPVVFRGSDPQPEGTKTTPFSAPLFDVHKRYVWVSAALSAAPGARLPEVSELAVLYPGRTLMENLPAIYQRAEAQPGSFLRGLVGVLEATTQDLDARIASLGRRIHPSTATAEWLDFVARWLGLPWDDGLALAQKQAIVAHASDLSKGRGTRAGLEALLESIAPGPPRRFRVTDATADLGFATVGGALPAILSGRTRSSAALNSRAVLGRMRLPCAGERDDAAGHLAGRILVEVAASAEERKAWEPWLLALIGDMVPLTARVELRFVGPDALRGDRLGDRLTLQPPPTPHLGTGTIAGIVRLPERGARLSAAGVDIGTPLR